MNTVDIAAATASHQKPPLAPAPAPGTVFLVAHNLAEIEASCNRVIWLEKGQIMMQGEDVPGIVDAYLEATGGEPRHRDRPDDNDHSA